MSKKTRASEALEKAEVIFSVHAYDYDPDAPRVGLQAAEALGQVPAQAFQDPDGRSRRQAACRRRFLSHCEVSMKKLAAPPSVGSWPT